MFCPECGNEVVDTAKSCTKCGRSLVKIKSASGGGSGVVKVLLVLLILVLIASAGYAVWSQLPQEDDDVQGYTGQDKQWVPVDFNFHGIKLDVPGTGWNLYYDAQSQMVFRDDVNGSLDINILGAISLNPDSYRVDNKPQVFRVLSQESIFLEGFGEAAYSVVQGNEDGRIVNKHQLYFRRTLKTPNKQSQTFTYLITMTCGSGVEAQYTPTYQHILESIELYEYE